MKNESPVSPSGSSATSPLGVLQSLLGSVRPPEWVVDEVQNHVVLFLNHVLMQEPQAQERLKRQKGKPVKVQWGDFHLTLAATAAGLLERPPGETPPELNVTLTQTSPLDIARRVLRLFEQPFDIGGQQVFSAASLGIVIGRSEYASPDQVLRDADTAMYRAKSAGKSGFVVFDEGMHQEALSRLQLETDFRLAFERAEFRVHYQPIVELQGGRLVGAEALVRWQHPRRGLLAPAEFLPLAEETGLIMDLDAWVLKQACAQLARWRAAHPELAGLSMNVNVDERQMVSPDIVDEVLSLLRKHQLPPACLRLEVTETAFRGGRGQAEQRLMALKALGVGLVVDDFGTGYSSLESFASSPFDALKMDQVFIRDIQTNPRHRAIVRTINSFANELGLALTAEGIETTGQRDALREIGCQFGQGFLYARALPPEQFEQMLSGIEGMVG